MISISTVSLLLYPMIFFHDASDPDAFRDFTSDPVTFPGSDVRSFIEELVSRRCNGYVPRLPEIFVSGCQPSAL